MSSHGPERFQTMSGHIFLHSIKLVFGQLGDALRISGLLYAAATIFGFIGLYLYVEATNANGGEPVLTWQSVLPAVISGVLSLWIAVAWHRYVLIDEAPARAVPRFRGKALLVYFLRLLQTALLVGLIAGFFGLIGGVVAALSGFPQFLYVVIVVLTVGGFALSYRLAPLLPAAALGKPVKLGDAWAATSEGIATLVGLAILSTIALFAIDLPLLAFPHLPLGTVTALAWTTATGWIKLMVGISILTTIYGVYVEKRSITPGA